MIVIRHFSKETFYRLIMPFIQVPQNSLTFSEISHNDVRHIGTSLTVTDQNLELKKNS